MLNKFQTNASGPQNKKLNKAPMSLKKTENPENIIKTNQNNSSSQLQKTANFGGNNSYSNNMTTPQKSLPNSGAKLSLAQDSILHSDQKNLRSQAEHRGVQRGFLLYTKAVEKQKMRFKTKLIVIYEFY